MSLADRLSALARCTAHDLVAIWLFHSTEEGITAQGQQRRKSCSHKRALQQAML